MTSIKGHFDGNAVVLDEPAMLKTGQLVRVIVESRPDVDLKELRRRSDEALQPVRDAFATSGITDDELAELLEIETHKIRGIPYPPE